ncbi:MAG: helix-turn-helix domain-containing protein [Polyangiaceae bacterium]
MARPTVIKNEVILEAARSVFLERGILATSAEVAQRAGVSEGSVFKRFKTKADLFRAAMGINLEELPDAILDLTSRIGTRSVEENLIEAGVQTVAFFERTMPIMMMSWSNPKVNGIIPEHCKVPDPPPLRAQRQIANYLLLEQQRGTLRTVEELGPHAAQVIARAYLGALSSYAFTDCLLPQQNPDVDTRLERIDPRDFVTSYVRMLLRGIGAVPVKTERDPASGRRPSSPRASRPHAA